MQNLTSKPKWQREESEHDSTYITNNGVINLELLQIIMSPNAPTSPLANADTVQTATNEFQATAKAPVKAVSMPNPFGGMVMSSLVGVRSSWTRDPVWNKNICKNSLSLIHYPGTLQSKTTFIRPLTGQPWPQSWPNAMK